MRAAVETDRDGLNTIRATRAVRARWGGTDFDREFDEALDSETLEFLAIEDGNGRLVGAIQWEAEDDPQYRHANVDVYIDPAVHGQGLGTDAVRTLIGHLFRDLDHHRITIDPAADNAAAIRTYQKVGFRAVGVMRQYERGPDGTWHDGLLMELLASDWPG